MTTLGTLKARIANDIDREDGSLDTEIAAAINDAIAHHQRNRFYFNVTRQVTFDTVAAQKNYDESDAAAIPFAVRIDALFKTVSDTITAVRRVEFLELEPLYQASATTGEPYYWSYYEQQIWLYPIPDQVYSMRADGMYLIDAPTSDAETDNPWMTEGFELLRCRAKIYLAIHKLRDPEMSQTMVQAEADVLQRMRADTARRAATNRLRSTYF